MNSKIVKKSLIKTLKSLKQMLPILTGVLMLVALAVVGIPKSFYTKIFTNNPIFDPLIGAIFGSFATGNPITSYIIGGELLKQGVSMIAIISFILTWVTVGIIQLPAESLILGKKFALIRNLVSFIMAMVISILMVFTLGAI